MSDEFSSFDAGGRGDDGAESCKRSSKAIILWTSIPGTNVPVMEFPVRERNRQKSAHGWSSFIFQVVNWGFLNCSSIPRQL